jgi:hypothetical protein
MVSFSSWAGNLPALCKQQRKVANITLKIETGVHYRFSEISANLGGIPGGIRLIDY